MIEQKRLALWLRKLGSRVPGMSDSLHIAQLLADTRDSTWILYLNAISERLASDSSYGAAIADPLCLDLRMEVQARLRTTNRSAAVDQILLDTAFELLATLSDYAQLRPMLNRAGFRYSQHRDYSRGPGPYDIDVYTAMTVSHPDSEITGETLNVSFMFTDAGELEGLRSYSMGKAPANPLRRGEEIPDYASVLERGDRRGERLWWLKLTTRTRDHAMSVTSQLARFVQGWAMQADDIELDISAAIELRGRARPFRGVELIEIGDGVHDALPASRLAEKDFACLRRLIADRAIVWCLHPLHSASGENVFPYNCFLSFNYPATTEDVELAKSTYAEELAKPH